MKKSILVLFLLLSGCQGSTPSDSSSPSSDSTNPIDSSSNQIESSSNSIDISSNPISSNPISSPLLSQWSQELNEEMLVMFGEPIPCLEAFDTVDYSHQANELGDVLFISSPTSLDLIEIYQTALVNDDYQLYEIINERTRNSYRYYKDFGTSVLWVEFTYRQQVFEITTYLFSPNYGWNGESISLMNTYLAMPLPYDSTLGPTYTVSIKPVESIYYLNLYCFTNNDVSSTYNKILKYLGYVYNQSSSTTDNYYFSKSISGSVQHVLVEVVRQNGKITIHLQGHLISDEPLLPTWSDDIAKEMIKYLGITIPYDLSLGNVCFIDGGVQDGINFINLYCYLAKYSVQPYIEVLGANGFSYLGTEVDEDGDDWYYFSKPHEGKTLYLMFVCYYFWDEYVFYISAYAE